MLLFWGWSRDVYAAGRGLFGGGLGAACSAEANWVVAAGPGRSSFIG